MTEIVTALLLFLSLCVFVAHALDAYLETRSVAMTDAP